MVRSIAFQQDPQGRPDPIRIAGMSVAILANLTLFAVLMTPLHYSEPVESHNDTQVIFDPPQIPLKPLPVPVDQRPQPQPNPQPNPQPKPKPTAEKLAEKPLVVDNQTGPMDFPLTQPLASGVDDGGEVSTQPVESELVPITSPAPTYPIGAMNDGVFGTVMLELVVGTDGRVLDVKVIHTSGDRRLDAAAREQVLRNWRFAPAMRGGKAVEALGRVPVVFRLDER